MQDYAIDCESTTYTFLYIICLVLILLWPLGVPAGLMSGMYRVRGAILEGDEKIVQKFDFVLTDYKTAYWHWVGLWIYS